MPHVVEVNDPRRLREFHLAWQLLLPQTPAASFFQSLDWLECYWQHFGNDQRLRVLVVYDENVPLGVVPLVVRTESLRVGRYRVLTYPLQDWGTFFGPIGPQPTATLLAALRHIRMNERDWDILDLRWVDRDGTDLGRTSNALRAIGFEHVERVWKRTAIVDLSDGWDVYQRLLPSKYRGELRRLLRRLEQQGEVRFERYRPDPLENDPAGCDWYQACLEVAQRSWQGGSQNGTTLCHPEVEPFLSQQHRLATKAGAVDVALLRLNDRPLAFAYNLHRDGRVFGLRTGYDPEFSRFGPGALLWRFMLQDSCQRGDQWFDLGPDSPQIKRRWATSFARSMHYRHYGQGARNTLLRMKDWWVGRASG